MERELPPVIVLIFLLLTPTGAQATPKGGETADASAPGRVFRDCTVCPEMVVLPAGTFAMGSPPSERGRNSDEGPQRKVTFAKAFAVGKFEVTFAQWDACSAEGACAHKPGDQGWGRGRRPVINVSWDDGKQFASWLTKKTGHSYRLPTEAEWEYAARGTKDDTEPSAPFHTGATINWRQANYDANFVYNGGPQGIYRQKTLDVGSLPRNGFGLHDMHGNVWEWVEDCYKGSYAGAPTDGSAVAARECSLRILRGGAWNYYPQLLRSAYRYATAPVVRLENTGFRVARSL
jgi:formylglycine-generating enzyme required for sulfatase activity